MPTRTVTIAVFFLFVLFVVIAAALGYVRWRLPVYYSTAAPAGGAAVALLRTPACPAAFQPAGVAREKIL